MKFGMVNKSATVNRFVFHTLQRNITHLAVITRKTNIKLGILKGGELEKSHRFYLIPMLTLCIKILSRNKFTLLCVFSDKKASK